MSYKVTVWNNETRRNEDREFATAEERDEFDAQRSREMAAWRRGAGMSWDSDSVNTEMSRERNCYRSDYGEIYV